MKKFLSLVLLAAILIQGCKSGADEALTDILLNESLAHISKLATAPGDSDEAQFQRLTERCAELATLRTAPLPPICPDGIGASSQGARALVATLSDEHLARIAEETAIAATAANNQARAAAVMRYWDWVAPLHRAISDLDARVTASLNEAERAVFSPKPGLALVEATDRRTIADGLTRAAEYLDAVPLVGEDEALSAATADLAAFRAALNASARASSDRQGLIRTLLEEVDNEVWQNAPSHAPTLPNLDAVKVRLAQTPAPAPVAEAAGTIRAFRNLQAFVSASLAVQLEVLEPGATEQFVRDCAALLVLDEATFDKVCGAVPTILSEVMDALAPPRSSAEPGEDSEPAAAETVEALLEAQAPLALDALKDRLKTLVWTRPVADRLVRERLAEMDAQQRASMVAVLINRIRIVQRNYAEAAFEGNFRHMVVIEARLGVIREGLARLSPRPLSASLDDPYALLMDRSVLLRGLAELLRLGRILDESIRLLGGDPLREVARHYISEKRRRMVRVLEAAPSLSDIIALLDTADPKERNAFLAVVERDLSETEKAEALRIERQRLEPLLVNLDRWRGPRGPPQDPNFPRSTRLLETFRQLFENPTHFVHQITLLRAEHTEFYEKLRREAPDQYPRWAFGADNYRGWIMAQMSPADLTNLRVMIAKLKPADGMPGGSAGWTEFGTELVEIDHQTELEQRRRGPPSTVPNGEPTPRGPGFGHPPRYPPDNPPELKAVAERYVDPLPTRQPSALELQARVSTISALFPSRETMPEALGDELDKLLKDRRDSEISRIDSIIEAIFGRDGLNERAARAVDAQDSIVLIALEDAKKSAADAVDAIQERVALMERAGLVKPDPALWTKMRTWPMRLGRPPPEKVDPLPISSAPNNGSGGTAAYRELGLDARIIKAERAISDALEKIEQAKPLRSATIIAAPIGAEKGRAVLNRPPQAAAAANLAQMMDPPDASKTRYPKDLADWKGFFDRTESTPEPFNFKSSVVQFPNFRGVGGGIHFGSHAEPDTNELHRITRGAHLGYDPRTQMLTLMLITGERFSYGPIGPRVLKALYSYVTSYPGINLAITIGATGDDIFSGEDGQTPVLLDPSFVDTPVGQSLYLADTLPWTLDRPKLPNNEDNPVSKPFEEATDAYRQYDEERLDALGNIVGAVRQLSALSETEIEKLIESTAATRTLSIALTSETFAQFKSRYIAYRSPELFREVLSFANFDEILATEIDQFKAFYTDDSNRAKRIIEAQRYLSDQSDSRVEVPAPVCRLVAAAVKELLPEELLPEMSTKDISRFLPILFGSTDRLAVLFDERVHFSLADGRLRIETTMRYRYAEADYEVKDGRLVFYLDANDPRNPARAREIERLGDIATENFTAIAAAFEPLARVHEYAGLAAFLRWASCAPESDDDCIARDSVTIDLSALGAFNLRDREATPTPDAEQRGD